MRLSRTSASNHPPHFWPTAPHRSTRYAIVFWGRSNGLAPPSSHWLSSAMTSTQMLASTPADPGSVPRTCPPLPGSAAAPGWVWRSLGRGIRATSQAAPGHGGAPSRLPGGRGGPSRRRPSRRGAPKKNLPDEAAPAGEVLQTVLGEMRWGGRSEREKATWRMQRSGLSVVGWHTRRIALSGFSTFCIKEMAIRLPKLARE